MPWKWGEESPSEDKQRADPVVEKAVRLNRQKRTAACEGGRRLSVVADQTVSLFGLDLTSA